MQPYILSLLGSFFIYIMAGMAFIPIFILRVRIWNYLRRIFKREVRERKE